MGQPRTMRAPHHPLNLLFFAIGATRPEWLAVARNLIKSNGSDAVSCIRIWDAVRTVHPLPNDLLGLDRLILNLNWTFLPFAAGSHLSSCCTSPLKNSDEPTTINFLRLSKIDNKRQRI